jgi:hypothetical protein
MNRYFNWRRRNKERFDEARSQDDFPRPWRGALNMLVPKPPLLAAGEQVFFDFACRRTSIGRFSAWIPSPFARDSFGRLTITSRRLIYRAGREAGFLWLLKAPPRIGDIEVELEQISSVRELPWRTRVGWGISFLPGVIMIELRLRDDRVVRFSDISRAFWERATRDLEAAGIYLTA